jgi:hypothetical protein
MVDSGLIMVNTELTDVNTGKVLDIMKKEKELFTKLNTYYTDYNSYIRCVNSGRRGDSICDNTETKNKMDNSLKKLDKCLIELNGLLSQVTSAERTQLNHDNYQRRFNQIKNSHQDILKRRSELDEQVNYINAAKQSYNNTYDNSNQTTIYTGIVLSVLATSLLYYVFVKL